MGIGKINKKIILAVTFGVIANLLSGGTAWAKKMEISDKEVEMIKTGLDIAKTIANIAAGDSKLKTILNSALKGGEVGMDVTYGLVVLSSFSEMEFMDLVVSQRYKAEATAYFNSILDEKTNLRNYYKGIGYDIPKIIMGNITGPMSALTLNTFDITNRTITALAAIKVLEKEIKYDALWVYFDQRRGNDSHEEAWELAKTKLGGIDPSVSFLGSNIRDENKSQLEAQFATLWDKWGPYTDSHGVKESFKKQVKGELGNTLISAINNHKFAEEKAVPSLFDKIKLAWEELVKKAGNMTELVKERLTRISAKIQNLSAFGGAQMTLISPENEEVTAVNIEQRQATAEVQLPRPQETQEVREVQEVKPQEPQKVLEEIVSEINVISQEIDRPLENSPQQQVSKLCEKIADSQPLRTSVVFNEIAWMGSASSSNNEWMKIKNISDSEVNLAGWQIVDKDQKIKITFSGERAAAGGTLLLERTDDNSLPGEKADLIYTGALNDTDEAIYLFDNNCQLQDEVLASPDWPGGDKANRQAMKRNSDLIWQSNAPAPAVFNYGTPTPVPSVAPPMQSQAKILISEVQISPIGERFIELYNPNNETINLTDWYIQRKTHSTSSWSSFVSSPNFEGKTIGALSYFLIASSSQADISLNLTLTEGNYLALKNSNREISDEINWDAVNSGQSFGRKWSAAIQDYGDFEMQTPTPKARNQSPGQATSEPATTTVAVLSTIETPTLSVIINEIAWAGTRASAADEWLELYNNSSSTVNLAGWSLKVATGTPNITFSTSSIAAGGYFLLERTNSSTTDVAENYIYTGALGNDGEKLELRDASSTLVDLVDFSSGWPAGSSSPNYISMERISPATSTWASNNLITRNGLDALGNKINGTPRAKNSVATSPTIISSLPFGEFSEISLTQFGSPYIISLNLTIPQEKTFNIRSGVILKFGNGISLTVDGALRAIGVENSKIIFAPLYDQNYWGQIYFSPQSKNSILENVLIENIGGPVKVESTSISFRNSEMQNTAVVALQLTNSSSTIENLTIQKNSTGEAVKISGGQPEMKNSKILNTYAGLTIRDGSRAKIIGNYFEGIAYPLGAIFVVDSYPLLQNNTGTSTNYLNGIYLSGVVNSNWLLYKNEIPYVIALLTVATGTALEIEAGTVISFVAPSGKMEVNGNLQAIGRESDKITFTALNTSSRWVAIHFTSQEATSTLKYVNINYGFGGGGLAAITVETARVEFRHLTFEGNYYNLSFKNSSQSIISDSEIKDGYRGIWIEGACPVMTNLSLNSTCNFASPSFPCVANAESICSP